MKASKKIINNNVENNSVKKHIPLTHRTWAKATAFVIVIASTAATLLCVTGAVLMMHENMYVTPKETYLTGIYTDIAQTDAVTVAEYVYSDQTSLAEEYCSGRNILSAQISGGADSFSWKADNYATEDSDIEITLYSRDGNSFLSHYDDSLSDYNITPKVTLKIPGKPVVHDNYLLAYRLVNLAYSLLYSVYIIGVLAVALVIAGFVFLMCASGRRGAEDKVQPGWGTGVPLDLMLALMAAVFAVLFKFCGSWWNSGFIATAASLVILVLSAQCMLLTLCMSLAVRIKLGGWWKNTVIYKALILIKRLLKQDWVLLKRLGGFAAKEIKALPLIPKTLLAIAVVTAVELIAIAFTWWEPDYCLFFWVVEKLVLIPVIICCALTLKKLQKGGEALAQGDLSYRINTEKMRGDFKTHGEALNSIGVGLNLAVEERLKSERMKTELITNVSHDIKTPLTSIINYTDLISKEPRGSEKTQEYSEVLLRQSTRLKRLIDDLVEASKASAGSLDVVLAPCDANILLTQATGEYVQKLVENNLELITRAPENTITVMADGRRLWRVFDNLMNNICKYAQKGTRVYLSLEEKDGKAVFTFKNTSHAPLNMSPDELMERFVRGDKSRNTEGNGLGLSIAKSLTELQKGTMDISIDGDLFKVTLKFPAVDQA